MKILLQIGVVFGVYWGSQCIEAVLPFPFPASVIGLLVLLGLLLLGVVKVDHIREKSDFLLGNLGFFFVPAGVGVMRYGDLFLREGLAIGAVLVISTLIAMLVTAYTIIFVDKLVHKNKNKD